MAEQTITNVSFGEHEYSITYTGERFGVCKGRYGRIKYLPVTWKYSAHCFPELRKTRLPLAGTAMELYETILTCARIKSSALECVQVCEHVLKYGRTPR